MAGATVAQCRPVAYAVACLSSLWKTQHRRQRRQKTGPLLDGSSVQVTFEQGSDVVWASERRRRRWEGELCSPAQGQRRHHYKGKCRGT